MLLIDISPSIEKSAESFKVFHLNSLVGWRHVRHCALPIRSSRSSRYLGTCL